MAYSEKENMIKLSQLKPNPNNPRMIKDDKFMKLVKSLETFPQMMELRPIIVDENNVIQGGNMRFKALLHLGVKEVPESYVRHGKDLTAEQWREFVIKDNVGFGEWNFEDLANEWDTEQLRDWGLDLPVWETDKDKTDLSGSLSTEFKIEIECFDETEQETTYNKLLSEGYKCRILTL